MFIEKTWPINSYSGVFFEGKGINVIFKELPNEIHEYTHSPCQIEFLVVKFNLVSSKKLRKQKKHQCKCYPMN